MTRYVELIWLVEEKLHERSLKSMGGKRSSEEVSETAAFGLSQPRLDEYAIRVQNCSIRGSGSSQDRTGLKRTKGYNRSANSLAQDPDDENPEECKVNDEISEKISTSSNEASS